MTGQVTEGGHILGGPGHQAYVVLEAALGRLQQGEGGEGEQAQGILGGRLSYSRDDGLSTPFTPTKKFREVHLY